MPWESIKWPLTLDSRKKLASVINYAARQAGVDNISAWIVGSYARGNAMPDSDIDVWIYAPVNLERVREMLPVGGDVFLLTELGKLPIEYTVHPSPPPTGYSRIDLILNGWFAWSRGGSGLGYPSFRR